MTAPPFPAAAIAAVRDAAKAHLRAGGDQEDALIEAQAGAAMALCEAFTGLSLIAREWTQTVGGGGGWQRLAAGPVVSIAAPAGGTVDIDAAGEGWVRIASGAASTVSIGYVAGLASDWDGVPAPLAQGVVLLTAHLFSGRPEGVAPPAAIAALWRPFRRMRLTGGERAA